MTDISPHIPYVEKSVFHGNGRYRKRVVRHKCCLNLSVDLSSRMTGDAVQKHSRQALLEED